MRLLHALSIALFCVSPLIAALGWYVVLVWVAIVWGAGLWVITHPEAAATLVYAGRE